MLGADPPLHKEAWHNMNGWYKSMVDHSPPPARVNLKWTTAELVELYHQVQPPGESIPLSVETFQVEYLVPTEDKI